MKNFFLSLFLLITISSYSQVNFNPVTWDLSFEAINDKEGFIVLKATIEDKWHIYSQKQNGDGPIPTSFKFSNSKAFVAVDSTMEPNAEKIYSEVFGTDVISFSKEVVFKQKIQRKNKKEFEIKGELEYMACNDNSCLPPKTIPFIITVPISSTAKTK
ncbi:MAG: sugar transporter [Bacteroidetes bacterium]|jgi:DsbC/DsbD-like thiol-disulfide interchange protein|nr:sugar transporter [Bacteroidota bacterium]